MKKHFSLALLLMISFAAAATNHIMPLSGDGGCFLIDNPAAPSILPGDTIFIDSSTAAARRYIFIRGLRGAPGRPIVIINRGYVSMHSGFDIEDTWYVEFSGQGMVGATDTAARHGCAMQLVGYFTDIDPQTGQMITYANGGMVQFHIHGTSKNIRVHHIEGTKGKYFMQLKNDEECDIRLNYPNWIIDSIEIDYNWGHFSESQWLYAGTTEPNNSFVQSRVKYCNGIPYFFDPGRLGNINVHHNLVEKSGRGGIQVSTATVGCSRIHHNIIRWPGGQLDDGQGGGITLGTYTNAIVDSNDITGSWSWNIINYGSQVRIYDNTMDSSGWTYHSIPDTLTRLAWAAPFTNKATFTIPVDSGKIWFFNNQMSHASVIENGLLDYAIGFSDNALNYTWSYDNRHFGNSYNDIDIHDGSTRITKPGAIRFVEAPCVITPLVNAGRDLVGTHLVHGSDTTLQGGGQALGGKTIASYQWMQISGPAAAVITTPGAPVTAVSNLVNGYYIFRLKIMDSAGASWTDDMMLYSASDGPPPAPPVRDIQFNGTLKFQNGTL